MMHNIAEHKKYILFKVTNRKVQTNDVIVHYHFLCDDSLQKFGKTVFDTKVSENIERHVNKSYKSKKKCYIANKPIFKLLQLLMKWCCVANLELKLLIHGRFTKLLLTGVNWLFT